MNNLLTSLKTFLQKYSNNYTNSDKIQKNCLALTILIILFMNFSKQLGFNTQLVYLAAFSLFIVLVLFSFLLFQTFKEMKHKTWSIVGLICNVLSLFLIVYITTNASYFAWAG